jgi:hypothetical protein
VETFVIRMWIPAGGSPLEEGDGPVRGFVDHVASGRSTAFKGSDEMVALLLAALRSRTGQSATGKEAERG